MFDADRDGTLNKGEYETNVKGIRFWGTDISTDMAYEATGWPKACKNLECCVDEGNTAESLRSILYEKHRASKSQAELDCCKVWVATTSAGIYLYR
mmetsp:Transcript_30524/g.81278  ORF Transcript_30524/g.81278 Transcript_30524/m.81278 type:complete len:96 (-) Transcript_30524:260-547(-)